VPVPFCDGLTAPIVGVETPECPTGAIQSGAFADYQINMLTISETTKPMLTHPRIRCGKMNSRNMTVVSWHVRP